jgi:hypothetical protein
MHPQRPEDCAQDRAGSAVIVLAAFHLPGADLQLRGAIVVRFHLLDKGPHLALDLADITLDLERASMILSFVVSTMVGSLNFKCS